MLYYIKPTEKDGRYSAKTYVAQYLIHMVIN